MSGLISSLQNSSAALRVHSKGLETVGKNLANINNPAYAKQRVAIGDRGQINTGIATEMMGVEAMELRQNRDSMLDKGVMRELTATSALEAAKHVLQSAETALGQFLDRTEDGTSIQNVTGATGGGISDALTDFFNAWESFSVKPNDVAEKQLLIAKAQILADKFNATDKRLNQVQSDVDQQVQTDLIVVNDLLNEIAEINDYIAKAENVKPFSAVDLRDQRQAKLEELSKYVDVTFKPYDPDPTSDEPFKSLGKVDVILNKADGTQLKIVDGSAVSVDPATAFAYDAENRILSFGGSNFSVNSVPNGSIAARLNASTVTVAETRASLSDLATQLVEQVNGAYQGDVFKLAKTNGIIDMSYNKDLKLAAGLDGGNRIALAVAELGTKIFEPTETPLFDSDTEHGFKDGDQVYATESGLLWIASGIDPSKLGVVADTPRYEVEVVTDKSFHLKNPDGSYVDGLVATSPVTKVRSYVEPTPVPLKPKVDPYITEFAFPDAAFEDGNKIQFTALPPETPDEVLDSKLVYTLQTNGNGFSILKPDGTPIQVTNEALFGVDGTFAPQIKEVADDSNTTTTLTAVTYGGAFYGDFALGEPDSFNNGDQIKFTGLPAGSPLEEGTVYTVSTLFVNSETGAETQEGQPNAIKVYQFNDINGNPVAGVNETSIGANTQVTLLGPTADPNNPKTSSISTLAIDPANPNQHLFTLLDENGVSLELSQADIGANTQIASSAISSEGTFLSFDQRNFEGSFAGNFNNIVTVLAQELNTTNIRLEDQELSEKMALETRDQYSGVSQDEEVTDMMKFQRSFQASARHINIIDSLLDQVVNRLGIG